MGIYFLLLLMYSMGTSFSLDDMLKVEDKIIWNIIEKDSTGRIDFSEFCTLWTKYNERDWSSEECLGAIFRGSDKDKSGYLTHDEIQELMIDNNNILSVTEIETFIKKLDIDGDGRVNFEEFLTT